MAYLGQMVWPMHLAVFYPHPLHTLPLWKILGALSLLILITIVCFMWRRGKPYLSVGWFLVPGNAGSRNRPDAGRRSGHGRPLHLYPAHRHLIMLAWGVPDLFGKWRYRKICLRYPCGGDSHPVRHSDMKPDPDLERPGRPIHSCRPVIPNNYWAYNNLGAAVGTQGNWDEAGDLFPEISGDNAVYTPAPTRIWLFFSTKEVVTGRSFLMCKRP